MDELSELLAPTTKRWRARRRGALGVTEQLKQDVARVHAVNYGVYGARKVWLQLRRLSSSSRP
jgi:putative transposase